MRASENCAETCLCHTQSRRIDRTALTCGASPTGRDRTLRAQRELAREESVRAAFSHDEHYQVRRRPTDLEAHAPAFDTNRTGRRPARAVGVATRQVPFAG